LERAKQLNHSKFAVLCLDLGQAANINFLLGKEYNKRVLKEAAKILKVILRPSDTIARLEGDTFVVLVEDVRNHETPILIASRVQSRIRKYLAKTENELQLQANVGVILCGDEYASVDEVLQDAQEALALAKSDRKKMLQMLRSKPMSATTNISTSPILR
jgi:diguanylate cyclase (GGDEF)-like protein